MWVWIHLMHYLDTGGTLFSSCGLCAQLVIQLFTGGEYISIRVGNCTATVAVRFSSSSTTIHLAMKNCSRNCNEVVLLMTDNKSVLFPGKCNFITTFVKFWMHFILGNNSLLRPLLYLPLKDLNVFQYYCMCIQKIHVLRLDTACLLCFLCMLLLTIHIALHMINYVLLQLANTYHAFTILLLGDCDVFAT